MSDITIAQHAADQADTLRRYAAQRHQDVLKLAAYTLQIKVRYVTDIDGTIVVSRRGEDEIRVYVGNCYRGTRRNLAHAIGHVVERVVVSEAEEFSFRCPYYDEVDDLHEAYAEAFARQVLAT